MEVLHFEISTCQRGSSCDMPYAFQNTPFHHDIAFLLRNIFQARNMTLHDYITPEIKHIQNCNVSQEIGTIPKPSCRDCQGIVVCANRWRTQTYCARCVPSTRCGPGSHFTAFCNTPWLSEFVSMGRVIWCLHRLTQCFLLVGFPG